MGLLPALPPGYIFAPTDAELLTHYLTRKVGGERDPRFFFVERDVYGAEPWKLLIDGDGGGKTLQDPHLLTPQDHTTAFPQSDFDLNGRGASEAYYFTRNRPLASSSKRRAGAGTWRSNTTNPDPVVTTNPEDGQSFVAGFKLPLTYVPDASSRKPSGWEMHEFRLPDCKAGDWILCRIRYNYRRSSSSSSKGEREMIHPPPPSSWPSSSSSSSSSSLLPEETVGIRFVPLKPQPPMVSESRQVRMSRKGGKKMMPNLNQHDHLTKALNLTVLQRLDPYVEEILITIAHVALYEFNIDVNQWSRKDIEGSLFVVRRNTTQPSRFQLIVMNRLNCDNLVEDLQLGDFEYEIQVPYLLYRNAAQAQQQVVNAIWFYDQLDCEAVGNLFGSRRILTVDSSSKVPPKAAKVSSSTKSCSELEDLEAVPDVTPVVVPDVVCCCYTRDKVRDALLKLFQDDTFVDMVHQEIL